jgi:hypothetical protein
MWAEGQLLVTSGLTFKQEMAVPDNSVRLYDLRTLKMIMPWPVPLGAAAVKISPAPTRWVYALCPLGYQISSLNLESEPLVRQTIPLSPADDVLCFDVSPNRELVAYGTVMGSVNILCSTSTAGAVSTTTTVGTVSLRYPGDADYGATDRDRWSATTVSPGRSRSSDWLGDARYWNRTRPLLDRRLLASSQIVDGIGYARNDRGILPNQVEIIPPSSSSHAILSQGPQYGMCHLMTDCHVCDAVS